jgi:4-hydroxythreonine-4-phosphate dehydrogenase
MRLGISLGDPRGVGAEITLKALAAGAAPDDTRCLLLGDGRQLVELNRQLQLNLELPEVANPAHQLTRFAVFNPAGTDATTTPALAAVAWLRCAGELCLAGELEAMITAPVNKEAIVRAGHPFIGQTEFLTELAGASRTVMMLLGHDERGRWLRVALATVHIALRDVSAQLSQDKILLAIERAAEACRRLGLPRARVGVCGLNPHCGEGGEFGDEEPRVIAPAVAAARAKGLDAVGPLSGDTVFTRRCGEFDAVVAISKGLCTEAVAFGLA